MVSPLIPALVGLFAISEAFMVIESGSLLSKDKIQQVRNANWSETFHGARPTLVAGLT